MAAPEAEAEGELTPAEARRFRMLKPLVQGIYNESVSTNPAIRERIQDFLAYFRSSNYVKDRREGKEPKYKVPANITLTDIRLILDAVDHPEKYDIRATGIPRSRGRPRRAEAAPRRGRPPAVEIPREAAAAAQPLVPEAGRVLLPEETIGISREAEAWVAMGLAARRRGARDYRDFLALIHAALAAPQTTERLKRITIQALQALGEPVPELAPPAPQAIPRTAVAPLRPQIPPLPREEKPAPPGLAMVPIDQEVVPVAELTVPEAVARLEALRGTSRKAGFKSAITSLLFEAAKEYRTHPDTYRDTKAVKILEAFRVETRPDFLKYLAPE